MAPHHLWPIITLFGPLFLAQGGPLPTAPMPLPPGPSVVAPLAIELPEYLAHYQRSTAPLSALQNEMLSHYQAFMGQLRSRDPELCTHLAYHLDAAQQDAQAFEQALVHSQWAFLPLSTYMEDQTHGAVQALPPDILRTYARAKSSHSALLEHKTSVQDQILPQMAEALKSRGCAHAVPEKAAPKSATPAAQKPARAIAQRAEDSTSAPENPVAKILHIESPKTRPSPTWGQAQAAPKSPLAPKRAAKSGVEFTIDNRRCPAPWILYIDDHRVGEIEAQSLTTLETAEGPHKLCLLNPDESPDTCEGAIRTLIYGGWQLRPGC